MFLDILWFKILLVEVNIENFAEVVEGLGWDWVENASRDLNIQVYITIETLNKCLLFLIYFEGRDGMNFMGDWICVAFNN